MAPVDISPAKCSSGSFDQICSFKANDLIPVHKYKSNVTGITVVVAEVEGPVVNGYFCLATEAHDDDGLPHTLEHLIFLGSESYPFKGVLDLLANRCLASGTNAWTDTDHTCYTMTTAGSEGFLSLMPIYIDHILYPTLTDHGFLTEVHHVTGEGEDAGVVYCEMQGRENTGESLSYLALLRAMYPGHCGYKSETGGVMKNLRESCNNTKVREYHKKFYRPENLTLIVTGQVKPEEVFRALQTVEDKIVLKGVRDAFTRPWQSSVPPLLDSVDLEVPYPCDEEDHGMVYVGWRGPSATKELYRMVACSILLKYLTDTAVSPLQRDFVEVEDPFASKVCYSLTENSQSMLYLMFENVPRDKLAFVKTRLTKLLESLTDRTELLNMTRMRSVIHRHILETLSHLENSPHESVAFIAIGDLLFGTSKEDFNHRLNQVEDLRLLEKEPEEFWVSLLKQYLVEAPSVVVRGVPSTKEQQEMTDKEKKRVEEQRAKLGEDGLKEKARLLQEAMAQNEKPPPKHMLTSVPIPSISSINFHPLKFYTAESSEQHPRFHLPQAPVYMHLDHLHTNFVYMFVLLNTSGLSTALRPYLPLFLESLLELPILRGDTLVPYEQVVAQLETDTISVSASIGLENSSRFHCGAFSHTAVLMLQLEPAKYSRCVTWIRELLYQTQFTVERLRILASKIANDVAQVKRKGNKVVSDLMKGLVYNQDSNHYSSSMLRQHKFLTSLLERLESPAMSQKVLQELEEVRAVLTQPANIVVHLAADMDKLPGDPAEPWAQMLPSGVNPKRIKLAVTPDWALLTPPCEQKNGSCVVGLGCIESSFLCQTTGCLRDFSHPDLAPLLVFLQYLTQLEGPMWRQIRGQGLSYGYSILPRPNEGLLYLALYRSTNCVAAYKEARNILECQLSPDAQWEVSLFESARSSLIFEVIEREKNVGDMVTQSLLSYFKAVEHDYNRLLVQLIAGVTVEDLKRVGPQYVARLFDPIHSQTSVVCHPSKVDEIAAGFKELGRELRVYPSLEDSLLSHW